MLLHHLLVVLVIVKLGISIYEITDTIENKMIK